MTILKLSKVQEDNEKLRIDSGYFGKLAIRTLQRIEELPHVRLGNAASSFRKGIFDIKADSYVEQGVPFVRISNLKNGLIDSTGIAFISPEVHAVEAKTALRYGDIILSKTAVPAASFVNLDECNASQDTIAVRLSKTWKKKLRSGYIAAFLNSRHGLSLMDRQFQGNVQAHLSLPDGKKLPIPLFGLDLQNSIEKAYISSNQKLQDASNQIAVAEQVLLSALGLENWQPPESLTTIRTASEAFAAGRLDSEHYQECYYDLRTRLLDSAKVTLTIGDLSESLTNGAEIREYQQKGTPYLRVGDIKHLTVDENSVVNVDEILAKKVISKVRLNAGDVLISRSGSLAVTAVVEPEWEHALISSHLIRLCIEDKRIDPYYLAFFLASTPGKMQIEQWSNGGVQPEINQPSLRKILVPHIDTSLQAEIKDCIGNSRKYREQAATLQETALCAVEIAIEQDEQAAMVYVKEREATHA